MKLRPTFFDQGNTRGLRVCRGPSRRTKGHTAASCLARTSTSCAMSVCGVTDPSHVAGALSDQQIARLHGFWTPSGRSKQGYRFRVLSPIDCVPRSGACGLYLRPVPCIDFVCVGVLCLCALDL